MKEVIFKVGDRVRVKTAQELDKIFDEGSSMIDGLYFNPRMNPLQGNTYVIDTVNTRNNRFSLVTDVVNDSPDITENTPWVLSGDFVDLLDDELRDLHKRVRADTGFKEELL